MAIEKLPAPRPGGHADLRVGCGEATCANTSVIAGTGKAKRWALTRDAAVLAEPRCGAHALDRYKGRAEVVILGKARTAPYFHAPPCNACVPALSNSRCCAGKIRAEWPNRRVEDCFAML